MSPFTPPDERPVTLAWITATIERHERTVPFGTLRTYLDHARERAGRPAHPDYARDFDLLKDTWLGVHETEILDYRYLRRITRHDLPPVPALPTYTVTVIGEERFYGEPGSTYVVHAPDLQAAKELVTEYFIVTCEKDIDMTTGRAMWGEPVVTEELDRPATGRDVLAYWAWARDTKTVAHATAKAYLQGARSVLSQLPTGIDTKIETLDLEAVIAAFAAANVGTRAPSTIAQYTSSFRKAVKEFLRQRGTEQPGTVRRRITGPDGRSMTVIAPAPAAEPGTPGGTEAGEAR